MADRATFQESAISYFDISGTNRDAWIHLQKETSSGSGIYEDFKISVDTLRTVFGLPRRLVMVVSQKGTSDPNIELILHNDFNAIIPSLSRVNDGQYRMDFPSGTFAVGNAVYLSSSFAQEDSVNVPIGTSTAIDIQYFLISDYRIHLLTMDAGTGVSDGLLNRTLITIEYYDHL